MASCLLDGKYPSVPLADKLQKAHRRREIQSVSIRPQLPLRSEHVVHRDSLQLPFLKAYALGRAKVLVGERVITRMDWRSEKAKEMFFFLLTNPLEYTREQILEALWPDLHPDKTRSMFHSTVHRLRQAVHPDCLLYNEKAYWLNRNVLCWYDVVEFRSLVKHAECLPPLSPERRAKLRDAIALYRGSFLEDFHSEWCAELARELHWEYAKGLLLLAECYSIRSESTEIISAVEKLLKLDAYNEDAIHQLMSTYAELGQPNIARECYRQYERMLRADLAAGPSARLKRLYDSLAASRQRSR